MKITTATKKDISDCIKLAKIRELKLTQGGYLDQEIFETLLKNDLFMVAKENESVIGFILGEPMRVSRGVMMWFFAVDGKRRSQGIGNQLIKEFEKRCKKLKRQWIILYAPSFNKKTLAFYKKHNYDAGIKLVEYFKWLG
ncbi:MAG: N-acetyltransferase [Candidatus Buchananbacteria bacterium]|jgi:ribosomal protein S18 acetylase RimI-like enzyme